MKWKQILAAGLTMSMMLGFTGCGGEKEGAGDAGGTQTASGEKQTVEFWMLPIIDDNNQRAMVEAFNAQSDTTHVNLTTLDWASGREQIKQAVASGAGPDVFYLGAGLDSAYIDGNLLLPLDENGYTAEDMGKLSKLNEANMVDGHLLAAAIYFDCYLLYYRTDVLEQFGFAEPPKTWDEMKSMAKTITEGSGGDIMGFQFKGADDQLNAINYSWQTMLAQAGGNLMDLENGVSTENSPEAVKALEFMKSFYTEGISTMGTSSNNGFREGKVAMYQFTCGPLTTEGFVDDPNMAGKWSVAALPAGDAGSGGYLGGQTVSVNAQTKVPEGAVEFVKWMTAPARMPEWFSQFYGVLPYDLEKLSAEERAACEKIYEKTPEIWEAINDSAEASTPDFMLQARNGYTARWDGQKRLIIAALTGEMEIEKALSQLDIEINQAL